MKHSAARVKDYSTCTPASEFSVAQGGLSSLERAACVERVLAAQAKQANCSGFRFGLTGPLIVVLGP